MDRDFLKWLEEERNEAFEIAEGHSNPRPSREYWWGHYHMLYFAIQEIKATMYKEATGK